MEILNIIFIIFFLLISVLPIFVIIFGILYECFFKSRILKRNISKAKILYPEYFILEKEQNELINNKEKIYLKYLNCTKDIDEINKNMPYTPNEQKAMKEMELEKLKKDRIKFFDEYNNIKNEFAIKTEKIENMVASSKLLLRIYRIN